MDREDEIHSLVDLNREARESYSPEAKLCCELILDCVRFLREIGWSEERIQTVFREGMKVTISPIVERDEANKG